MRTRWPLALDVLRGVTALSALVLLASATGCATAAPPAQHSPTALCTDPTLDHRNLYCANELPRGAQSR
jgi:hypothetical protein